MTAAEQALKFNQMFEQALKEVKTYPEVGWHPCSRIGGERDYRYRLCFTELSGSAQPTMQKMAKALTNAGFKNTATGSNSSELDGSFIMKDSPYSLTTMFGSMGIMWMAYDDNRGKIGPRPGLDGDDAPYALLSPAEFAEHQAEQYVMFADLTQAQRVTKPLYQPCGTPTPTQASFCLTIPISHEQAVTPFVRVYFAGNKSEFSQFNASIGSVFTDQNRIDRLIRDGVLEKGDKSPKTFKKTSDTTYIFTDTWDHPAYQMIFEIPSKSTADQKVKITAKRIPITPEIRKSHLTRP